MLPSRWLVAAATIAATSASAVTAARAGSLAGKLDLPNPPDRPAVASKGFTDRVVNPIAPIKPPSVGTNLAVVLDSDDKAAPTGGTQVTWELAGDAFTHAVLAVPVGTEVVLKNTSRTAHILAAAEDPKLVPSGPLQQNSPHSFRVTEANANKTYTISDAATPWLKGKLVVTEARYTAGVDENGKFDFADVPAGTYKLRIYYYHPADNKDGWLDRPDDTVTIPAKGRAEITAKVPPNYPVKAK